MRRASILFLLVASALTAHAAEPAEAEPEALSAWEWYEDITLDAAQSPRRVDFVLPPSVFDKARPDLADLRLYDSSGRVIPYALRVRRGRDEQEPLTAKEFNRVTHADHSVELSLDLDNAPVEHNEIRVNMIAANVRRRVQLEGSNDDKKWSTLLDHAQWLTFRASEQKIDLRTFRYPVSRYRYLRVHVWPDRGLDNDLPSIDSVIVRRSIQIPAENITLPANVGRREPVRADGDPGSEWFIDFGGDRVPCEELAFDIADEEFVRPYRLELAESDGTQSFLTSGEWRRERSDKPRTMVITFRETLARRLRLVVTDHRNAPLNVRSASSTAPARQVIFDPPADVVPPLRLYFGNPDAAAPHYDFAATLPPELKPTPLRGRLGELTKNPDYRPPPLPWSERWPWLVYVVLSVASLVLLVLLGLLGREAIAQHDRRASANSATPG
jgi:hypothetical protein